MDHCPRQILKLQAAECAYERGYVSKREKDKEKESEAEMSVWGHAINKFFFAL